MVVANDLNVVLDNLQRNGLVFGAYADEEERYLVCQTPYFPELSLPCVKMYAGEEVTSKFSPMFKNEFQITPMIRNYVELVRGSYMDGDIQKNGNFICLYITEYPYFPLKDNPELRPSGDYTDIRYITYDEAKHLYSIGELNEYTMFYISRIHNWRAENESMGTNRNNV